MSTLATTPIEDNTPVIPESNSAVSDIGENKTTLNSAISNSAQQTASVLHQAPARTQPTTISNPDLWEDIKAHPLFAPWRDPESMEWPEGKPRTKKPGSDIGKGKNESGSEGKGQNAPEGKNTADSKENKKQKNAADDNEGRNNTAEQNESADKNKDSGEKNKKTDEAKKDKKPGFLKKIFSNPTISYNPLARGRHRGKSAVKGALTVPTRIVAKAAHVIGRPQQLFEGEARSDVFKNTGRGITNFFRGVTGAIYKPHRESLKYENVFKDYGAGRGVGQTTNPAKLFTRGFSKFMPALFPYPVPIKFASHMLQGVSHFVADTVSGKTNYEHTSHAFKKAFGWNYTIK